MVRPAEFLDEAIAEAEEAAQWYAEHSALAAESFAEEILAGILAIEQAPDAWPRHDHGTRRFLLHRFPYSIVYRAEPHRVVIVAVAHAHRLPGYWKDRNVTPG